MSDPAFVMEPVEPPAETIGCPVPPDAIGLNLSPIMAKCVTASDMDDWLAIGVEVVRILLRLQAAVCCSFRMSQRNPATIMLS